MFLEEMGVDLGEQELYMEQNEFEFSKKRELPRQHSE